MTVLRTSARLGAAALVLASALGAQTRPNGSGIPISKDAPPVRTTTSEGRVAPITSGPAVLPTFSVAAYGPLTEKHMTFIMAAGDSAEIQLGHLAHTKGTAQSVKDYGMMLVSDHTAHLAKVHEIITDEDVGVEAPPTNPEGARTKAMLAWLQNNPASREWDAAYLRFQAQHHQNLYDLFSANLKQAHDDDLEDLIEKSLVSFTKHRDAAKSAATGLGITIQ